MGNCQAVNAAVLVLQHPGGKVDRYYGSVSVSEVMGMYPGHYVSLIIPLMEEEEKNTPAIVIKGDDKKQKKAVMFTRVQLLRPTENLVLGHAYRLITSQEVMKVLREKKCAKTKKQHSATTMTVKKLSEKKAPVDSLLIDLWKREKKQGKQFRVLTNSTSILKSKTWRPSLQSISEATS